MGSEGAVNLRLRSSGAACGPNRLVSDDYPTHAAFPPFRPARARFFDNSKRSLLVRICYGDDSMLVGRRSGHFAEMRVRAHFETIRAVTATRMDTGESYFRALTGRTRHVIIAS